MAAGGAIMKGMGNKPAIRLGAGLALAALLASGAPVMATQPLQQLLAMMPSSDPTRAFQAALAGCLLGGGDGPATADLFARRGMQVYPAPEMGIYEIVSHDEAIFVLLALDGGFCDVSSAMLGTDDAEHLASASLFEATRTDPRRSRSTDGCRQLSAPGLPPLVIRSDGQDPVCISSAGAAVRFHFH